MPFAARLASEGFRVSTMGFPRATSLLGYVEDDFKILGDRVMPLLAQGYFDTAVREACIGIESLIKTSIASNSWGDALANEFIIDLRKADRLLESYLRVLRGQLRTALKFIRNDVMHNFLRINDTECRAILLRLARVRSQIEYVCADMTPRWPPATPTADCLSRYPLRAPLEAVKALKRPLPNNALAIVTREADKEDRAGA
ncbi:hypothetical protein [Bradyrhizobium sp. SZCCHNRI20481]|uniref:hypothetical protein n=1 Tax=Bradyrhizobium sp. SZCCHNRI20481 TaxID=3057286 RepID=UPI0029166BEE|nr:hypothetical protein [Bradyrhizobium sp. SZCCHNRI20481]